MVTDSRPPETVSEPENEGPADVPALATEAHAASVHDALLETVSADALEAGTGAHDTEDSHAQEPAAQESAAHQPVEAPETVTADASEAEPAPVMQPPEALEAAPDAVTLPDVASEPEAVPEPEAVSEAETVREPVSAAAIETASIAVASAPGAILHTGGASFDVIGEITEVNATILAFLRSEGSAAVAHWQSLSGARTPADAIRIQVDELQRAADASLTCFNVLARRAGRLAAGIGRA